MRSATAWTSGNVPPRSNRWLSPVIVSLGVAVGPLDTAVNIAFPAITTAFAIPVTTIQWVVICYVLTYASLLLGCGRLGDVIGHRRVFLFGLGWSAISLYLCGWAPTFGWFLLFRSLQGIGTALVLSCAPALVTLAFPEAERGKALGVYTMLSAVAATCGPLLGGQLVALWGWSAVFYFRVPIACIAAILTVFWVQQPVGVPPGQRFDSVGAVTLTAAIAGLLLALNQGNHLGWLTLPTLLLGGGAVGCLGWCIWYELHCAEPVLDLRLFRHAAFSIANMAHVLVNVASFTVLLLVPYYLLNSYQVSALVGGVLLALSPLGSMIASPLGGWLVSHFASSRLSLYGLSLVSAGLLGISQWQEHSAISLVAGMLVLQGFGLGLFQVANMDFVMGVIPRQQQGVAGSLTMLTRTVGIVAGATLGSFLLGLLQARYTVQLQATGVSVATIGPQAFLLAFQRTFQFAAVIAAVAGGLLWSSRFTTAPS
jgi:EmrB/QacA subfamily drug resistance transporter